MKRPKEWLLFPNPEGEKLREKIEAMSEGEFIAFIEELFRQEEARIRARRFCRWTGYIAIATILLIGIAIGRGCS